MPIQKMTKIVTILVEAATPEEADRIYADMDLADIAEAITTGDDIGQMTDAGPTTTVAPDDLRTLLLSMGNDGEYFSYLEDAMPHPEDRLVTARVTFDVTAGGIDEAKTKAAELLSDKMEASDIFGTAEIEAVHAAPGRDGLYGAVGVVGFRIVTQGADADRGFAESRLKDEVIRSGLFKSGVVSTIEDDSTQNDEG